MRARLAWARVKWPAAMAATMDISPHRQVAATTSAKAAALPAPLSPRMFNPADWLGNPLLAMPAVIISDMWTGVPFQAVLLLAGLLGVPLELKEAAQAHRDLEARKTMGSVVLLP